MNQGWYALQVRPRAERSVAHHLEDRGYEAFVPYYLSRRTWSDRVKEIVLPLFPSYVFCEVTESAVSRVVTTPGVVRFVGVGNSPIAIERAEINALKQIVGAFNDPQPWPFLRVGQRVEILVGPLKGVRGLLTDFGNGNRLVVSITLLQRSVAVELRECDVMTVADPLSVDHAS